MMAPSITCQLCLRTSYNANDIEQGYCGYCNTWTYGLVVTAEGLGISWRLLHAASDPIASAALGVKVTEFDPDITPRHFNRWQRFWTQFYLCRTRELTRPLGVGHAIKHAWKVAWH